VSDGYSVAVIHYRADDQLGSCLDAIGAQVRPPDSVLVVDVDRDVPRPEELSGRRGVGWVAMENRGFAGGANVALHELCRATHSEFFLLLNPDVRLEPEFASVLVNEMVGWPRAGIGSGKLVRPSGEIDSAGIILPASRRPRDRGADEPDRGQYDRVETVFGAAGAALLIRRAALEELALDGEVFDEDFFLYHEDTDLAWRAGLLGWEVLYVPRARAEHSRGWRRGHRYEIPSAIRRHSFKNHYLQLIKNEEPFDFVLRLPVLLAHELLRLANALLFDRAVLPAYRDAWRLRRRAWAKRRMLRRAMRERH